MREAERRSAADLNPHSASTLWESSQVEPPDESELVADVSERRKGGDPGVPRTSPTRAALSARGEATRNACGDMPSPSAPTFYLATFYLAAGCGVAVGFANFASSIGTLSFTLVMRSVARVDNSIRDVAGSIRTTNGIFTPLPVLRYSSKST